MMKSNKNYFLQIANLFCMVCHISIEDYRGFTRILYEASVTRKNRQMSIKVAQK